MRIRWGACFNPGKNFSLYLSHLGKACQLLNIPPAWYNNAVRGVARGLENAQDLILKFENYIFKTLFRKLIAHESIRSECGRLFYLAYVFILRLPSEALPAVRAGPHEPLLARAKLSRQSALGLRTFPGGGQRLVLKIRTRKHMRGGAVLRRPCFCDSDTLSTRGICPIHDFWRIIRESTQWGEPPFPSLLKRSSNRIPKGALSTMGVTEAFSYSAHAFRSGASMKLKRCSDTLAHVVKTIGWISATFRSYLSFADDEAVNIRLIPMNREGGESPCGESGDSLVSASPHGDYPGLPPSSVSSTSESL